MLFCLRRDRRACGSRALREHAHSVADDARSVEDVVEMGRPAAVSNALCQVRNSLVR